MNHRRIIFMLFFAAWLPRMASAQAGKNVISVFFAPALTKTNFEAILDKNPGSFKEFYETVEPDKAVQGYSYGISYTRKIKTAYLGLSIHQNLRGQRSEYAYNYRGLIPTDTLAGYGGLYYHFKMKSLTLAMIVGKNLHISSSYTADFLLSIGLDVYQIAFLEEFIVKSEDGTLENGCCRAEYLHYPGNYFKNLFDRFEDGYYRASFSLSFRNSFKLFKNINLDISPQAFLLTKILKDSPVLNTYVPDGKIWALGLNFGLGYNF